MVTEGDFLLPPWSIEGLEACFFVSDSTGRKLAYVYFEDDPGRRTAAKLLSKDEAHRIAVNIAKLPELVRKPWPSNGLDYRQPPGLTWP